MREKDRERYEKVRGMDYGLLREKPFYLDDAQVKWVKDTLGHMTEEEKIGQLFCLTSYSAEEEQLKKMTEVYRVGGVMGRKMPLEELHKMVSVLQEHAKIPLLIAANFEAGGDGLIEEGTNVGPNLQIGATGKPEFAGKQGYVCAREGAAAGANWAFAPVIDIDCNFRNPIMATRLYGKDPKLVKECGREYTKAAQANGLAVSVKHFPGDGVDERDQHLVTSINSMSCEAWDATYGEAYRACIEEGALTVMAGHIMMPEYSRKLCPGIRDEDIRPASLAPELLHGLLREKLGFNGVIVTDATTMVGFTCVMDRKDAVPQAIAAGCDIFLFTKNLDEDYEYMRQGVRDGVITKERLDEAVMRILGLKAALRLPEKKRTGTLVPSLEYARSVIGCAEHREIERECADRSVTLVKNKEDIFPLTPAKYRRVLLYPITSGKNALGYDGGDDVTEGIKAALEREGFAVDVFRPLPGREGSLHRYDEIKENYDLLLYAANLMTKSNQTVVRIEWEQPMGANCPIYVNVIPTIFLSFANPYHLIDVPRIKTYINVYKYKPANLEAVLDKMLGRSEFKGRDPVDSFCGMWDTKL